MRVKKFQPKELIERKIHGYIYRIQKLDNGLFLISKMLDGQVLVEYYEELQASCTCPDYNQRRAKNQEACKHVQMVLIALAKGSSRCSCKKEGRFELYKSSR